VKINQPTPIVVFACTSSAVDPSSTKNESALILAHIASPTRLKVSAARVAGNDD